MLCHTWIQNILKVFELWKRKSCVRLLWKSFSIARFNTLHCLFLPKRFLPCAKIKIFTWHSGLLSAAQWDHVFWSKCSKPQTPTLWGHYTTINLFHRIKMCWSEQMTNIRQKKTAAATIKNNQHHPTPSNRININRAKWRTDLFGGKVAPEACVKPAVCDSGVKLEQISLSWVERIFAMLMAYFII